MTTERTTVDAAWETDVGYIAARLRESAWGTRANLDQPEAQTVARYLVSFGIRREAAIGAESESRDDAYESGRLDEEAVWRDRWAESEAKVVALREAALRVLAQADRDTDAFNALRAALAVTEGSEP